MIWRSLIFISFLGSIFGATVSGRIELRDSREASVRQKKNFSGVVVSLDPVEKKAIKNESGKARMVQKNKTFSPHILPVISGTTVDFPNFDPIFHSAFSNYNGQIFDIGLYPPGTSRSVRFSREGVVRIFCNIHPQMSAAIVVLGTPWFDVSKVDGSFAIRDVPVGEYRLNFFHERATDETLKQLSRGISISSDTVTIEPISISESGYLTIPHKNKYGHDYRPPPNDEGAYPSVRK